MLAWQLAPVFGVSAHFAVGHGLVLLQLLRLLRPLDRREKLFSLIVAVGHLAVACTVVLDYRFIVILLASLILLPRSLVELESESFTGNGGAVPRPGFASQLAVLAVMVAVFLVLPRGLLGGPIAARLPGSDASVNRLDSMLDPARSGAANSSRVLFQVDAAEVGYLKMMAMVDFENGQWEADELMFNWRPIHQPRPDWTDAHHRRRVRVKDTGFLQRVLPVDGQVTRVSGRFFRAPGRNGHGLIVCDSIWNSANNVYEYWVRPRPVPEDLPAHEHAMYVAHPPVTPAVRAWLDARVAGAKDPHAQARRLEHYLRENFRYEIGAPSLNRLNALEEFILQEQRGHCERFASALALLLRELNIPCRVMVGFVPGERNWISGWYDVRWRDAHAWVEAHFPERGWVQFDATPRASLPPPGWDPAELLDALDVIWYLNIVNFDATAQRGFLQVSVQGFGEVLDGARRHARALLLLVALGGLGAWLRPRWGVWRRSTQADSASLSAQFASDTYGRMLALLARHGRTRRPHETPAEFLAQLRDEPDPVLAPVEHVTTVFCLTRYGERVLSAAEQQALEAELKQLEGALTGDAAARGRIGASVRPAP